MRASDICGLSHPNLSLNVFTGSVVKECGYRLNRRLTTSSSEAFMKIKFYLLLCIAISGVACSDSLNSMDGPKSGTVSGLVCNDLPTLAAVSEVPAIRNSLISEGKCSNLTRRAGVKVLRTVMMPGDGKYSQFETTVRGNTKKLWARTSYIREA